MATNDSPDAVVVGSAGPATLPKGTSDQQFTTDQENFKIGKVYPGDLVVYKSKHPWDWSPTYGTVVVHGSYRGPAAGSVTTTNMQGTLYSNRVPPPAPSPASTSTSTSANPPPPNNANTFKKPVSDTAIITIEEQPMPLSPTKLDASPEIKDNEVQDKRDDRGAIATATATGSKPATATEIEEEAEPNFTVHWDSSNRVRQMKRSEVCVIDRMLVRGTRVRNNEGVGGIVTNYNVKATLQIVGTNHIIQSVPLADLQPISMFVRGQDVLYKNWVGMVTNVKRKVWFRLDGGLSFHIETMESDGFMKTDPYWGLGVACPGVRTPFSHAVLKNAKWTSKHMKFLWKWVPPLSFLHSFSSATVTRVDASALTIKWLAPAANSTLIAAPVPPPTVLEQTDMEDLQILSMPNSEYAGLNSVRVYRLKPEDHMTTYGTWFSQFRHKFMEHGTNRSYTNFFSTPATPIKQLAGAKINEVPVKILLRHNFVDIQWDNGKKERLSSIDVPVVYEPKASDSLRCGMVVVSDMDTPDSKRYGVVQLSEDSIEGGTNTVSVHWFCEGSQRDRVVQDEGVMEESVYSLRPHVKYSLFQRETILFSTDPELHEFNAGIVIDVDVKQGNMIIFCTDRRYRKVWPHMVLPFSKRCSWNFFTRKWVVDDIIPPPHQLGIENYPKDSKLSAVQVEETLVRLKNRNKPRGLWEEPPFDLLEAAPELHSYIRPEVASVDKDLIRFVRNEFDLIRSSLPEAVWIRVYENRMDLVSVMIIGPSKTPYEDGLFLFDMKLPANFPQSPPKVHFISYSAEIHPLVAEDGNFCEVNLNWNYEGDQESHLHEPKSYILEAVRTLQGLFYTNEPFYADGIRSKENATAEDVEKCRSYNEMIFLQILDTYYQAVLKPHEPWSRHIAEHVLSTLPTKVAMVDKWFDFQTEEETGASLNSRNYPRLPSEPPFPLLPVSRGFRMTLESRMKNLRTILAMCAEPPTPEPVTPDYPFKVTKRGSPSSLLNTIQEILHEQKREMKEVLKGNTEEDDDQDIQEQSNFSFADL